MNYLMEFTGEHRSLPFGELKGVLEAEYKNFSAELDSPGIGVVKMENDQKRTFSRLALCRSISELKFVCDEITHPNVEQEIKKGIKSFKGSFAIDAKRLFGYNPDVSTTALKKTIGGAIKSISPSEIRVDMTDPDHTYKLLLSKKCYVGKLIYDIDRKSMESRYGRNRPYFTPVSLHPKFARTMVNLARVRKKMSILDPFCGTGGIILEGSAMGMRVTGSDIQNKMVDGTRQNFDFFELPYDDLTVCDVKDCGFNYNKFDAVITDPPYGRAASTSGEDIQNLYERMFLTIKDLLKAKRYLVIMLPDKKYLELGEADFKLKEDYSVYVHRSLTRHLCIYQN